MSRTQRALGGFGPTLAALGALGSISLASGSALAQAPLPELSAPERSDGWSSATDVLVLSSVAVQLLAPRVFYADPEVTVGWRARWHVSVLAPTMTLAALALYNEQELKETFESYRPGCSEENAGAPGCETFGMFSSHSLLAFSMLGQGVGKVLVDSTRWSGGRFNPGALALDVGVPAVLAILTAVGRTAGNFESGGQVWGSAGVGFGLGLGLGVLYATLQRPACGYSASLVCW